MGLHIPPRIEFLWNIAYANRLNAEPFKNLPSSFCNGYNKSMMKNFLQ